MLSIFFPITESSNVNICKYYFNKVRSPVGINRVYIQTIYKNVKVVQPMTNIPREDGIDHSISLMREGYMYIFNRRKSFQSDLFETRLLGQKVICMGGMEAAELFYDQEKFQRAGAAPNRVKESLFGESGVQTLDGKSHQLRKNVFLSLLSNDRLSEITQLTRKHWEVTLQKWQQQNEIILYDEVKELLCRAAYEWAGLPINEDELKETAVSVSNLFESAGKLGPNHWKGRMSRNQLEKNIAEIIDDVRTEKINPPEDSPLLAFATFVDADGNLLPSKIAAVEVLNIVRPIVAIAIYINFVALSIIHYPEEVAKLKNGNGENIEWFIQEVRRFYPFFPAVIARVKQDFTWNGYLFNKGTLTMLDLYGTNHDPAIWEQPDLFMPSRFANRKEHLYDFIPQGGGDVRGHRCPGEQFTIDIMKISLDFLVNHMEYDIPNQDLSYSLVNMPSIPNSKIILKRKRIN